SDDSAAGRVVRVRCRRHSWLAEGRKEAYVKSPDLSELLLLLLLLLIIVNIVSVIFEFKPILLGFGSGIGLPGCRLRVKAPPTVVGRIELLIWELGAEGRLHSLRES
ncbi:hypothetical protein PMAYCL1PPCAC_09084, partial [Pristionchus mayeri]